MKYNLLLGLFIVCTITGCGTKHYFELEGNSVSFYYRDAGAHEVLFASSLDNFTYHAATRIKKDLWKISIPSGEGFSYFYRVDGIITIPDCPFTENDDFGARNCLYLP